MAQRPRGEQLRVGRDGGRRQYGRRSLYVRKVRATAESSVARASPDRPPIPLHCVAFSGCAHGPKPERACGCVRTGAQRPPSRVAASIARPNSRQQRVLSRHDGRLVLLSFLLPRFLFPSPWHVSVLIVLRWPSHMSPCPYAVICTLDGILDRVPCSPRLRPRQPPHTPSHRAPIRTAGAAVRARAPHPRMRRPSRPRGPPRPARRAAVGAWPQRAYSPRLVVCRAPREPAMTRRLLRTEHLVACALVKSR